MRARIGYKAATAALALAGAAAALGCTSASAAVGITNGGFDTGDLTGWTKSGTTSVSVDGRTGYSAQLGSTVPTKGASTISQAFTVPSGMTTFSAYYLMTCNGTGDYLTITLSDGTSRGTKTLVSKACTKNYTWTQVSSAVTAGKTYTFSVTNYDNNKAGTASYTQVDDVTLA